MIAFLVNDCLEYKQKKKFYEKLHGRTLDGLMRLPSYSSNSISSHPVSIENYDDSVFFLLWHKF